MKIRKEFVLFSRNDLLIMFIAVFTPVIYEKDDKFLTESDKVLERLTKYCTGLYNYQINPDPSVLEDSNTQRESIESPPVLKAEVVAAMMSLKPDKSPGVDNVPAELLKYGGDHTVDALTVLCQKIWDQKKSPEEWTK